MISIIEAPFNDATDAEVAESKFNEWWDDLLKSSEVKVHYLGLKVTLVKVKVP